MMKTQLGLGILAIPASFDQLGLIPGIICLFLVATLTGWASYMIGTFKQRHQGVYGLDDAARLMFGRIGYELFSAIFCICMSYKTLQDTTALTDARLDFYCWIRNAGYFHRPERCIFTRNMHCSICCSGCIHGFLPWKYPYARSDKLARMGWTCVYPHF